nr:MAG TPA: hypothetical protein [Caudoviricetes sp.]
MASTNFKLFDENKANMMSDTEYNINTQRLNGVQAGIASSRLQNKTLYQTSLVAYSLAQIMMQNGFDAKDSASVSAFVSNMSNSLLQKVLDKATSVEAQNGVNNTKWMTPALTKAAIDILAAKSSNILSNETKTLYGLGADAVPNDVLAELGKYKQYWWRRRAKTVVEKRTDITGEVQVTRDSSPGRKFYYSKTVSLDPNGGVSLVSPVTLDGVASSTTSANTLSDSLKPYLDDVPYYISSDIVDGEIYYVPTGSDIGYNSGNSGYFTFGLYRYSSKTFYMVLSNDSLSDPKVPAQLVKSSIQISDWQYVQSSNRNAYPDSGTQDGYEYEYLGVPFDNAVTASKIMTGTYSGTGKYGESNPNSLTFEFEPKMVFMFEGAFPLTRNVSSQTTHPVYGTTIGMTTTYSKSLFNIYSMRSGDDYYLYAKKSSDGKTLSWYHGASARAQMNEVGVVYNYVAIA